VGIKTHRSDLAREGVGWLKKSDSWHYMHLLDPRSLSAGSVMPEYSWLHENELDITTTPAKIRAMQKLGVPYPEGYDQIANDDLMKQAEEIAASLKKDDIETEPTVEVIAIIAYLQRLGKDLETENALNASNTK